MGFEPIPFMAYRGFPFSPLDNYSIADRGQKVNRVFDSYFFNNRLDKSNRPGRKGFT